MKRLIVLIALLAIAGSASAGTIGVWKGGTGLWSDATKWSSGSVPAAPATSTGDEIKVQGTSSNVTIDSTATLDHNCRLTAGAASPVTINIVDGANFGMNEYRNGAVPNASTNGTCTTLQTGGTLTVTDLLMGRGGSSSAVTTAIANGQYTISGGTIQGRTGSGRLYIAGGQNTYTGTAVDRINGTFTVDGAAGVINMKQMFVGGDNATHYGVGALEFIVKDAGVSRISLDGMGSSTAIYLDPQTGAGTANLKLSFAGTTMVSGNIVLVENKGTAAVSGVFDQLNGVVGAANQGAAVILGDRKSVV